jgi:hypothetical protein
MKLNTIVAASIVAIGLACAGFGTAEAEIVDVTYTGTISTGWDLYGLFGTPGALNGDPYVVTYTVDTANDTASNVPGWSQDAVSSPGSVSAAITINGITQLISGDYRGQANVRLISPAPFPPTPVSPKLTHELAEDYYTKNNIVTADQVYNSQESISGPTLSSPIQITIVDTISGTISFRTDNNNYGRFGIIGTTEEVTANFNSLGTVEVSGVAAAPEPAAWALMVLGVGGMGAALRRVKRRPLVPIVGLA